MLNKHFQFLDLTESIVAMKDEQYYSVNDILKNEIITINNANNKEEKLIETLQKTLEIV